MKYFIFLIAFTLEDCGQALLQFYYYERFQSQFNILTIINGVYTALKSLYNMVSMAMYSVKRKNGLYE